MYIIHEKEKFQRYFRHSEDKTPIASTTVSNLCLNNYHITIICHHNVRWKRRNNNFKTD